MLHLWIMWSVLTPCCSKRVRRVGEGDTGFVIASFPFPVSALMFHEKDVGCCQASILSPSGTSDIYRDDLVRPPGASGMYRWLRSMGLPNPKASLFVAAL